MTALAGWQTIRIRGVRVYEHNRDQRQSAGSRSGCFIGCVV
jgi:hypothetical protein